MLPAPPWITRRGVVVIELDIICKGMEINAQLSLRPLVPYIPVSRSKVPYLLKYYYY